MNLHLKNRSAFSEELQCAFRAAVCAGDFLLEHHNRMHPAKVKDGNRGLVTLYDRQAEQMIRDELCRRFPYAILGEELGRKATGAHSDDKLLWCVDPIDGTANFTHRLPFFVISIALLHNRAARAGVIYQPSAQQCFYAEKGKGAFVNGERMTVSQKRNSLEAILWIDHGYHANDQHRSVHVLQRLGRQFETRKLGTTALEMALLAQGLADVFICSGDEIWDYAAGMLLVREAGGRVTDWTGKEINGESAFLCASNGIFHQLVIDAIRDLQNGGDDSKPGNGPR